MKARMRRLSVSIDSSGIDSHQHGDKNTEVSRIDRVRKLLSSPLTRRKSSCNPSLSGSSSNLRTFGSSLSVLAHRQCPSPSKSSPALKEPNIPYVMSRLCDFIESNSGMFCEGLFRVSGNAKLIEKLRQSFDSSGDAPLETDGDVPSAAALLKLFLRELPEPVIPLQLHPLFLEAAKEYSLDKEGAIVTIKELISLLPEENFSMLKYLSSFLRRVSNHESQNRMNSSSLGIVFGPNLFRVNADDYEGLKEQAITNQVVGAFITDYCFLFEEDSDENLGKHELGNLEPLHVDIPVNVITESVQRKQDFSSVPLLALNSQIISSKTKGTKRKEQRQSSESPNIRSSSEERNPKEAAELDIRRCNSSEEMSSRFPQSIPLRNDEVQLDANFNPTMPKRRHNELGNLPPTDCPSSAMNVYHSPALAANSKAETECEKTVVSDTKSKDGSSSTCATSMMLCSTNTRENVPALDVESLHLNANSNEPIVSEHRYSWPFVKDSHVKDDDSSKSTNATYPIVKNVAQQILRNSSKSCPYEAPVSPSAFRNFLSQRPQLADSTIPPSPPIEQDAFESLRKSSLETADMKEVRRKIKSLKKKLKYFEIDYEVEHGYRPSLDHKLSSSKARPLVIEISKLKQKLLELRDDSLCDFDSESNLRLYNEENEHSGVFEIEDFSNVPRHAKSNGYELEVALTDIQESLGLKRRLVDRPVNLDVMSDEQILDEKLDLQKALLKFENVYGRPDNRIDRDIMRPLYDRYRVIKRMVTRFPSKQLRETSDLKPIPENVAMSFDCDIQVKPDAVASTLVNDDSNVVPVNSRRLSTNYHELPLHELLRHMNDVRLEKRHLRRIIKNFEDDFKSRFARKVEKADRVHLETVYRDYKQSKGKLRLIEALISKSQRKDYLE
ncbi:Protein FAM13A [Halotydeus destructor]|nr:Protein FAM13A [Halotydeus destructor]